MNPAPKEDPARAELALEGAKVVGPEIYEKIFPMTSQLRQVEEAEVLLRGMSGAEVVAGLLTWRRTIGGVR